MRDKPKLSIVLLKSKMLKAIPELKTNNKSTIGIKGMVWPSSKYCSAMNFVARSIAIKKILKSSLFLY